MIESIPVFMWLALAGGLCVTLMAGPLGAFVVWRKMAYFGDTLAHGALLGIALSFFIKLNPFYTLLGTCVVIALVLAFLQRAQSLASDTVLGILSHGALAAGLVCISFIQDARVDLMAFLFGDLLTITTTDIGIFLVVDILVLGVMAWLWKPLLLATIDEALARAEGVNTERIKLILLVLMAVVVAIAMRVVGVLLITALFIIPAAAARPLSRNPEPMVLIAIALGMVSVVVGLTASYFWDIPTGPSIVLGALILFVMTHAVARLIQLSRVAR